MGLLTNPTGDESSKIVQLLQKHSSKLGVLTFVAGYCWLAILANAQYNLGTYFSENALLPGLVVENFVDANRVSSFLSTLQELETAHGGRLSPDDFSHLLRTIGLIEIEQQTFKLIHPVPGGDGNGSREAVGRNVFGVLRAKRSAGTEALVFNTPYFPNNSAARRNLNGIATMLALAEYFKNQVYWAKDIVFLIPEGHLGSLAWVKGHQEINDDNQNLILESVRTKAGNIQAAINVIFEGSPICSLETRFHGVNGQLPNLDLVNLLNKFVVNDNEKRADWKADIWKLFNYMNIQGTGTPTGSHGFFLKYGIESVTLSGKTGKSCKRAIGSGDVGRILEATFRSLNNLLERFHQSFFFYLKTTPNRFISIGLYFPPIALMLFCIPMKAASIWLTQKDLETSSSLVQLLVIHSMTLGFRWLLSHLSIFLPSNVEVSPEIFTYILLGFCATTFITAQIILRKTTQDSAIYCYCLLELATCLYCLALFNPSLVILVASRLCPTATILFFGQPKKRRWLHIALLAIVIGQVCFYFHPLVHGVNKYFYESQIYGNFLFDFFFVITLPVFSILLAVV